MSKKIELMYTYTDPDEEYFDEDCANRLLKQIQCYKITDVYTLLSVVPPISKLIKSIPFSLPIFDAIYTRVNQLQNHGVEEFPTDALMCADLFRQLVWWTALNDLAQTSSVSSSLSSTSHHGDGLTFTHDAYHRNYGVVLKTKYSVHIRTILSIIQRECSGVIEKAEKERAFLASCLESLGCHGLVNCSTGLIRLFDAIRLETQKHQEKVRGISCRLKEMYRAKQPPDVVPSCASHQRQMNLHLSQIFERLKQNEYMENILNGMLSNRHLNSLLRIVRRRIQSDKMLINVFNFLNKAAPEDFAFDDVDPVVAKLVISFKNAYDKLLHMIPAESDNGYGNESEVRCCSNCSQSASKGYYARSQRDPLESSYSSSTPNINQKKLPIKFSLQLQRHIYTTPLSKPISRVFSKCSKNGLPGFSHLRRFRTADDFNRSFAQLQQSDKKIKAKKRITKSLSRLNISDYGVSHDPLYSNAKTDSENNGAKVVDDKRNPNVFDSWLLNQRYLPEPDYPDAVEYCIYSTEEEIVEVAERFSSLFLNGRKEVMLALSCLPEFVDSEELQLKIIFTVVILTYRSIYESVARRRNEVYEILDNELPNNIGNPHLDLALYRHMHRKAKSECGMANAKEVTSQIWSTLFDFPSLKTCTRFNRFILECVSVVWDLVTGIDGKLPRMTIDYEGDIFDPDKHQRFNDSSPISTVIQQFLWPALINTSNNQYLCKAFVIT